MAKNLKTVTGSIEFRETVWNLSKNGTVCAREHGTHAPSYHLVDADRDFFRKVTVDDLFHGPYAPIRTEEFATALWREEEDGGPATKIDVFNI